MGLSPVSHLYVPYTYAVTYGTGITHRPPPLAAVWALVKYPSRTHTRTYVRTTLRTPGSNVRTLRSYCTVCRLTLITSYRYVVPHGTYGKVPVPVLVWYVPYGMQSAEVWAYKYRTYGSTVPYGTVPNRTVPYGWLCTILLYGNHAFK